MTALLLKVGWSFSLTLWDFFSTLATNQSLSLISKLLPFTLAAEHGFIMYSLSALSPYLPSLPRSFSLLYPPFYITLFLSISSLILSFAFSLKLLCSFHSNSLSLVYLNVSPFSGLSTVVLFSCHFVVFLLIPLCRYTANKKLIDVTAELKTPVKAKANYQHLSAIKTFWQLALWYVFKSSMKPLH